MCHVSRGRAQVPAANQPGAGCSLSARKTYGFGQVSIRAGRRPQPRVNLVSAVHRRPRKRGLRRPGREPPVDVPLDRREARRPLLDRPLGARPVAAQVHARRRAHEHDEGVGWWASGGSVRSGPSAVPGRELRNDDCLAAVRRDTSSRIDGSRNATPRTGLRRATIAWSGGRAPETCASAAARPIRGTPGAFESSRRTTLEECRDYPDCLDYPGCPSRRCRPQDRCYPVHRLRRYCPCCRYCRYCP